jgi:hypothetical protein
MPVDVSISIMRASFAVLWQGAGVFSPWMRPECGVVCARVSACVCVCVCVCVRVRERGRGQQ